MSTFAAISSEEGVAKRNEKLVTLLKNSYLLHVERRWQFCFQCKIGNIISVAESAQSGNCRNKYFLIISAQKLREIY